MFGNGLVSALLRSPLHGLISGAVMLVSVKGRRSGRLVSTPVNFVRDGTTLWVVSWPGRLWWRNLRGGAPVTLRLAGRDVAARGAALESVDDIAAALDRILARQPGLRRQLGLPAPIPGIPDVDVIRAAGPKNVVIRFDPVAGEKP